jgi:hypothetical protein
VDRHYNFLKSLYGGEPLVTVVWGLRRVGYNDIGARFGTHQPIWPSETANEINMLLCQALSRSGRHLRTAAEGGNQVLVSRLIYQVLWPFAFYSALH